MRTPIIILASTFASAILVNDALAQRASFAYTGAVASYTVPTTGTYQIIAYGAQGGSSGCSLGVGCANPPAPGGMGAEIGGNFNLTQGEVLQIAVGGVGELNEGGDGTFVIGPNNTPLVIAGGGGGGGAGQDGSFNPPPLPSQGGLTTTQGGNSLAGSKGGANGSGGAAVVFGGGGGGGFFTDGATAGGGGAGGMSWAHLTPANFRSGGAGSGRGGGGGGGYSGGGGGGGDHYVNGPGGGGGSFNGGTSQILTANTQTGDGEVVITLVADPPAALAGTPGRSNCLSQSVAALVQQAGGMNAAAMAMGFSSPAVMQLAAARFCGP